MITTPKTKKDVLFLVSIGVLVLLIGSLIIFKAVQSMNHQSINNFHDCKQAGGAIAESYPEQCFIDGKSFSNPDQKVDEPTDEYVGLSEQEALSEAEQNDKIARVVERDGESLPVTMDYMPGRLNFHVSDGKIEKVVVEGAQE